MLESLTAGSRLGHYKILGKLGAGGMGEVYRAEDLKLERPVAIKLLPPGAAGDREAVERLVREAKLASSLQHPGIVTIFAIEEEDGAPYLVMELVEGETLRSRIERGALEPADLVSIGIQVADALDAAHRVGLIHRDIKSANILVTPDGRAKVADFGLAKRLPGLTGDLDATAAALTATGAVVGTAAYMSPEQTRGEELDSRTDIFSLGVVLYEAATGRLPFEGPTALSVLHEIALVEPPAPSRVRAGVPRELDSVILRAMSKDKARRFATAGELAAALRMVGRADVAVAAAAPDGAVAAPAVPNNLPMALTSFVGRQTEMEEVVRLLGPARLVTLTGAGGCGKSRLSVQIARNLMERYPDGVWLVELAALSDPTLLPQRVATVFGIREERGRPMIETLREALAGQTFLLILDNCEHMTPACANLALALTAACPDARILATSREPLGVPGEVLWRVPPLRTPPSDSARTLSRAEIGRFESARLFVERASTVLPGFALHEKNAAIVAQICIRLDGIPLAIELAAARIKVLPVGQILSRLEDRFRLLTAGASGAVPHHQTLRATVDWSYGLLADKERMLFDRLSVFAGGATLEAVEAVCSSRGIEDEEILDLVTNLVDKSLVIPEEGTGGTARYMLLETLREYGRERLQQSGESDPTLERHARFYVALVERAEPELTGGDQSMWLTRLEEEHDNLRRASEHLVQARRAEEALRLSGALWRFYRIHGHLGEGRSRLETALSLETADDRARYARAKALLGAGALARSQSDYQRARTLLEEGLAVGRLAGNREATAGILLELGIASNDQGRHAEARAFHQECLAIRRALGDRRGVSVVLHNLGVASQALGDYAEAQSLYEESLAIKRELGHKGGEANTLNALGSIALDQSDYSAARSYHEEALAIHRRLGDRYGIAYSLRELGRAAIGLGDTSSAHGLLADSIAIAQTTGDRLSVAETLEHFAALASAEADDERALVLAGAAAALHAELGAPLSDQDLTSVERSLAASKARLGGSAVQAAIERGRSMPLERVIHLATSARWTP